MAVPRCAGGRSLTIWSPIITSPRLIASWPAIIRSVLVLPHPDGPSRQQ